MPKRDSQMPKVPDFSHETRVLERAQGPVCGVDEAGRGPWAGPVVAAAVILDPGNLPVGLNDSKKLSEERREALFDQIWEQARVGIGIADAGRIDQMNILQATMYAMQTAVSQLAPQPKFALIDGNMIPDGLTCGAEALVKGDGRSLSIAAASIVAKVVRDRIMVDLAQQHPGYGWEKNAGYGTKAHMEALQNLGVTPHHRRSFKPVHNML